jgi:hypothetical protein
MTQTSTSNSSPSYTPRMWQPQVGMRVTDQLRGTGIVVARNPAAKWRDYADVTFDDDGQTARAHVSRLRAVKPIFTVIAGGLSVPIAAPDTKVAAIDRAGAVA